MTTKTYYEDKTMYLKIMGSEDAPDNDPRKTFNLYEVDGWVSFNRDEEEGARVCFGCGPGDLEPTELKIETNAYLMNSDGKTVAHFGPAKLPR